MKERLFYLLFLSAVMVGVVSLAVLFIDIVKGFIAVQFIPHLNFDKILFRGLLSKITSPKFSLIFYVISLCYVIFFVQLFQM